jgi:hypothetical protein
LHRYTVVGPLIDTIRHLKLEHYSLKHKESDFEALMKCVVDIFLQHSSRRVAGLYTLNAVDPYDRKRLVSSTLEPVK